MQETHFEESTIKESCLKKPCLEESRFEKGIRQLDQIDGEGGRHVIKSLENIAPDLGRYIVEFAFGDIYTRSGLSLQERELITLSSLLTAGGCESQLKVHISAALNVGIPAGTIIETMIQCIPYTGFPKVLNAVSAAREVFTSRPSCPDPERV